MSIESNIGKKAGSNNGCLYNLCRPIIQNELATVGDIWENIHPSIIYNSYALRVTRGRGTNPS